jgi:DNA-binding transcriptional ArsR family regulator
MPKTRTDRVFAALGDEIRLGLVRRLSRAGPASISALAADFGVTRQAVTKHLHVLATAGIVKGRRAGREHIWTLDPARLTEARRCLDAIGKGWDDVLARLKAHIENE